MLRFTAVHSIQANVTMSLQRGSQPTDNHFVNVHILLLPPSQLATLPNSLRYEAACDLSSYNDGPSTVCTPANSVDFNLGLGEHCQG